MIIKLTELHEACGGCPSRFTGKTEDGQYFEAYLRNGFMRIDVGDRRIVSCNPRDYDGVCSFDVFKQYARRYGYIIDDSESTQTSFVDEINALFADYREVEFLRDVDLPKSNLFYKKGKRQRLHPKVAEAIVERGFGFYVDKIEGSL